MNYTINEDIAKKAWRNGHMTDYEAGSATEEYNQLVQECVEIGEKQKSEVHEYWHSKIDYYVDLYARKLAENINAINSANATMPAWFIAGPANYNVKKWEKVQSRVDKLMAEYLKIKGIPEKIETIGMSGISSDLPEAENLIQDEINRLLEANEIAKAANRYIKKNGKLDGFEYEGKPLSSEFYDNYFGGKFDTSSNSAKIRRLKERLEDMKQSRDLQGWEFNGGTVEVDTENNRLKIFFDEKPNAEIRQKMKRHGFRYAPSTSAWQRKLSLNAVRDIKFYMPELMAETN